MKKQDELSPEERKLLQEFKACNNEAERHAWIQKNRDLFQPAAEQRDNMTFYSGGVAGSNRREAEIHCERHSAIMLEQTKGGRILEKADLYNKVGPEQSTRLFVSASETYVESAQGKVRAFTMLAREERVFLNIELPKLLNNKDVTHINEVPRKELLRAWHNDQSPDKQEARREVADKINQGIKQIGWDGDKTEQKQEPPQSDLQPKQRRDVSEERIEKAFKVGVASFLEEKIRERFPELGDIEVEFEEEPSRKERGRDIEKAGEERVVRFKGGEDHVEVEGLDSEEELEQLMRENPRLAKAIDELREGEELVIEIEEEIDIEQEREREEQTVERGKDKER